MLETKGYLYEITFPEGHGVSRGFAVGVEFRDNPSREGISGFKGLCYLTPPDRGHMIRGEQKSGDSERFVFTSSKTFQGDWTLTRITKENFLERCQGIVMGCVEINEECKTTEELEDWFYSRFLPNGG